MTVFAEDGDEDIEAAQEAITMQECPYYQNEREVCVTGCWEEPLCQTSQPIEGWASVPGQFVIDR